MDSSGSFKMPRSGTVSEKVWAQAIHAVNVQKMSLRRAAQLYGVHHMSLHRRVKGRYIQNLQHMDPDFHLTPKEESEINTVLSEQFHFEKKVTADDVRYVVRTIISQSGRKLPQEFPNNRWIARYKKLNGFNSSSDVKMQVDHQSDGTNGCRPSLQHLQGEEEEDPTEEEEEEDQANCTAQEKEDPLSKLKLDMAMMTRTKSSDAVSPNSAESQICQDEEQEHYSDSGNSETDQKCPDSSISSSTNNADEQETTSDAAATSDHSSSTQVINDSNSNKYQQSQTVTPEVWEKAMDAVELHGMSLRNAAKAYGVHFAALHRRVKKRSLRQMAVASAENYLPFEDEAGIVRVINARADLGILMNYDELVELLHRTALKYTPSLSYEKGRNLVSKFQRRTEHSIQHLIKDWSTSNESYVATKNNGNSTFNATAIARSLGVVTSSESNGMTGGSKNFSALPCPMGVLPSVTSSIGRKESPPLLPSLRHDLLRRTTGNGSFSRDPREMLLSRNDSMADRDPRDRVSPLNMYAPRSNACAVYAPIRHHEQPLSSPIDRMCSSHPRFAMRDGVFPHVHSSHDSRIYHETNHVPRRIISSTSSNSQTNGNTSAAICSSMQF
jgi:transposase